MSIVEIVHFESFGTRLGAISSEILQRFAGLGTRFRAEGRRFGWPSDLMTRYLPPSSAFNTFRTDGRRGTPWLDDLTPEMCRRYYQALAQRMAVDSHRNILAQVRTFLGWCVKKTWLNANPLDGVQGVGKRRHGKKQLHIDEARRWLAEAIGNAEEGNVGAVVAMAALLLGLRASEILKRQVRDLDDGGRLLWIDDTKTEAGRRTLEVPALLQPHLLRLAHDRKAEDLLFGEHDRSYALQWVKRLCKAAGVPAVCAHSMRGLHSTLSRESGITGEVVALALGHADKRVTEQSYTLPAAVSNAKQRRVLEVLAGGKK